MMRGTGWLLTAVAACCAGCSAGGAAITDPTVAKRQLGEQLDGTRVCPTLVAATGPLEFGADVTGAPSLDALAAARLIDRQPLPAVAGERLRVRIVAGPAAKADFRLRPTTDGAIMPELCIGKRKVTAVRIESDGSGGQRLRYRFRIADAPAWTGDPAIRRAFPFLARLLDGEQTGQAAAFATDGRWAIPNDPEADMATQIGNKGFLPCPVPDRDPDSPCT